MVCGFLQKGVAFISTPIFTRIMTESEYGRYTVYNSWYSILTIVITLNLAAGVYTRGLIKFEKDQDAFSSSMLGLSTTVIIIFSLIYGVFHNFFNDLFGISSFLMILMLLEVWSNEAYLFWSNRERVAYKYKKIVALTFAFAILRPLMGIIGVLNVKENLQVEARVSATVLVNLVLFVGLFIAILKKGKKVIDFKYWKYALKFNIPLLPHYLSQIILSQSDKLMINHYCGTEEAAFYGVAYSLAMIMLVFNNSVSATMNPWIYRSIKNKQHEKIANVSYPIICIIAILNLFVLALAPELLSILAPSTYNSALWVIPPLILNVYFMFLYNLFATFEYYFEKTAFIMIASVLAAAANIVLNMIFIPKYGFVAAGYTSLACYIIYAAAHYLFMRYVCKKYIGDKPIYNLAIIIIIALVFMIMATTMVLLFNYPIVRFSLLLIGAIVLFLIKDKIISIFSKLKQN